MPRVAALAREAAVTTLGAFADQHGLSLVRFAYALCGDRGFAEDLVQDTYLALYRRYGSELPLDAPVAYARRSIVNACISKSRRRASRELVAADLPDVPFAPPDRGEQDAMWRALATLSDRQRAVLVLRYYVDLPDSDIAQVLHASQGTVRSLAARAFAALRDHPALSATEDQR